MDNVKSIIRYQTTEYGSTRVKLAEMLDSPKPPAHTDRCEV